MQLQSVVRDVCSSVNEQFLHLVEKEEERQRQEEQAAAQSQAPVKTKMLRRLSKAAAEQQTTTMEKKGSKKKKEDKKTGKKGESMGGRKTKKEKTRSTVEERADRDFVLIPLDSSDLSGTSQGTGSPVDLKGDEGLAEEIGKQFLAVTKTPSAVKGGRKLGKKLRGPKLKRLSTTESGSLSKRARNLLSINQSMESFDNVSTVELLPPLAVSKSPAKHDGNVVTQKLANTDGIRVPDVLDYLSSHSRTRLTVGPDSFPASASGSEPTLEPMLTSQPMLEPATPSITRPLPTRPSPPRKTFPYSPPPQNLPSPKRKTAPSPLQPPQTPSPPPPAASLLSPPPLTPSPTVPAPESRETGEQGGMEVSPGTKTSGDSFKCKSRTSLLLETVEDGEVETM